MPDEPNLSDYEYVRRQYRQTANLDARIRLHQQCSTNPTGWFHWLFDQLAIPPACRLLELGGGTGSLWFDNRHRLPASSDLLLSDLSPGMMQQCRQDLASLSPSFEFLNIDAQNIPFPARTFDVVIANHMLYHVPNRSAALAEIRRVLKPGGVLYASTIGQNHLREFNDLLNRFGHGLEHEFHNHTNTFTLENGAAQLEAFFPQVSLARYPDSLRVTAAALLTDYALSGRDQASDQLHCDLLHYIEQQLILTGQISITKDSGLFTAVRN